MNRPAPGHAPVLYAMSATCTAIGALLWVRGWSSSPPRAYAGFLAADGYTPSAWRVWSRAVPDERLGLYLVAAGLVPAVAARMISVRRG
ncbi:MULTISPECIES: hypothetical protein [unclassified Streptomyces]|uniref:hypothetical protein n=1 Tax=unclassified Streptomyces TaxID=2593676 RepID=UPI00339DBADB